MLTEFDASIIMRTLEYHCNNKEGNYTNAHISLAVKGGTKGQLGRNKRPKQAPDSFSALLQLATIQECKPPESAVVSVYSVTLNELGELAQSAHEPTEFYVLCQGLPHTQQTPLNLLGAPYFWS